MATSVVRARLAATVSLVALSLATPTLALQAQEQAATIDDIIVTAQKREESIQSVPISVSAFNSEMLDALKIEGGSELLRAIPNVTFSKNNFSMYNFSIRGIGTKAISAASDPAVAVSFNNSPMIRNRLFESEYLDVNRVEVLRGPQGTLYGRNATAGVVNMIPNLPSSRFESMLKSEVGNFGSVRGQLMLNIPIADNFWVRGAASATKRDGFDYNAYNDTQINGRDLHSVRLSALWHPSEKLSASLFWERFGEDDDRARTGKQLCTRDPGPDRIGTASVTTQFMQGKLSQGCLPGSLYNDAAYAAPNGSGMGQLYVLSTVSPGRIDPLNVFYIVDEGVDPFAGVKQSRNLREYSLYYDPKFQASNDVIQFNVDYDLSDKLTLKFQHLYTEDSYWSTQDYNRYLSNEILKYNPNLVTSIGLPIVDGTVYDSNGNYVDPQLGATRRMVSADLSQSESNQSYTELRAESSFGGPFNFSLGLGYTDFETEDNYYVFNNTFSLLAEYFYNRNSATDGLSTVKCQDSNQFYECVYVDYSGIGNIAGDGHNYFRSKNYIKTKSWAAFGEGYLNLSDSLSMTVGLRYTEDEKTTTPYPTQLLLGYSDIQGAPSTGGRLARGLRALPDVVQSWSAVTGRAVLDWKPNEDTMIYASYARGYKGGGTNPPRPDLDPAVVQFQFQAETFEPEYVDAFELGFKTTVFNDTLRLNGSLFYNDYSNYQVSQIVDRISLNENFDAETYGAEIEFVYKPTRQIRIDGNVGLLRTKIGEGQGSVDVMNRTQGDPNWTLVRPWIQVPSNCIAPTSLVEKVLNNGLGSALPGYSLAALCGGASRIGSYDPTFPSTWPFWFFMGVDYNPLRDAPNGGRGIEADLSGNDLPNAPRYTASVGAQYTFELNSWDLTFRGDYYIQGDSYFRVYNTEYDRIKSWSNSNFQVSLVNDESGLEFLLYVKNVFDDSPIVDAFTNSDDSMLTTNVFTLDPRIVGFSIKKTF